ncbi:uncharacterized protein CDAR_273281 [Caerostris darwini]|uniref:Selenoprotein n=1 Tax=Caerostris darwini TaxID=1538125 RepID=A0AAV4TWK0_9ARAC|nr:uncharacterized protein CDAR_273281 [Caerostris darwini]
MARYGKAGGKDLQKKILKAVPEAEVTGRVGRLRSFEIVVNGVLAFSKLKKGKFPNFDEIVEVVASVEEGEDVKQL